MHMALWLIWLILGGLLLVAEMLTLTFYLLWFGVGAFVAAAIAGLTPGSLAVQIVAGCLTVIGLTVFTKPLTRRFRASRGFQDAVDTLVGKQGVVVEAIVQGKPGIVKVGNETWSATSSETLQQGDVVIVVNRGSAVLEVHKWGGVS